LPKAASLVRFLTATVAFCVFFFISGDVSCAILHLCCHLWCCFTLASVSGALSYPAVASVLVSCPSWRSLCSFLPLVSPLLLFPAPSIASGAVSCPIYCLWCCFLPHLSPLVLFPATSIASGAVSCPIYRLWCCFLPHLSPLVLFLTQAVATVTFSVLPCCRLPKLSPSALFLDQVLTPTLELFLPQAFTNCVLFYLSCRLPQVLFVTQVEGGGGL
jgi:hypothetical protein